MRRIGLICAGEQELAPFLARMERERTEERAMLTVHLGTLGRAPAAAVCSGVCKVNAAIAAQTLIDEAGAEVILSAGTAGGISPEAELFDTVVAQRAAYHDVAEEILTQLHPHLPSAWFPGDGALLALARRYSQGAKHPIRFGGIVTGERFVTGERRTRLYQKFGALAADMETAAIAHVCFVRRVPFLSVRTISDTLEADGAESFAANCARASEIAAEVVSDLAELFSGAAGQPARRTGR